MATKIPYFYTEYKDCPEATEVSHSRERGKVFHYIFCVLNFLMSLLFCFATPNWICFCGLGVSVLWFVYLITRYDKVTEKRIQVALEVDIENNIKRALEKKYPIKDILLNATEQDMPTRKEKLLLDKYKKLSLEYSLIENKLHIEGIGIFLKVNLLVKKANIKNKLLNIEENEKINKTVWNLRQKEMKNEENIERLLSDRKKNRLF